MPVVGVVVKVGVVIVIVVTGVGVVAFEREVTWLDSIGVRSKDAARCAVRYCSLTLAAQG